MVFESVVVRVGVSSVDEDWFVDGDGKSVVVVNTLFDFDDELVIVLVSY